MDNYTFTFSLYNIQFYLVKMWIYKHVSQLSAAVVLIYVLRFNSYHLLM